VSVRLRRLRGDLEVVGRTFPADGRIRVRETKGSPPDRYLVEYLVTGLAQTSDGRIVKRQEHLVQVTLTLGYPRQAPLCRMMTPIFHPNIAPHAVCVGDHWAAGESLAHLLVRIAELITWQSYNTKSPLNGEAARWADRNRHRLPVDSVDLAGFYDERAGARPMAALPCANCGGRNGVEACAGRHPACNDCRTPCPTCGAATCLVCPKTTCARCGGPACPSCALPCGNCRAVLCPVHRSPCGGCGTAFCGDCGDACPACGSFRCVAHLAACDHGGGAPAA
jgi:ubiquitin-protein ligase